MTAQLRTRATADSVSLNTLLQAAWAVLLHRYSGESDIVFGVTRAGRGFDLADADGFVGLFINTLPLRTMVTDDSAISDWLRSLREQQRSMRPHEYTPLATVQSLSDMPRGMPLFESVVVYEHRSLDAQLRDAGDGWSVRQFEYIGQTNFPLSVIAYGDDEMLLRLEYSKERFDDRTIDRMLEHVVTLLKHLSEGVVKQVGELTMLTAAERAALVGEGKALSAFAVHGTLHDRFAEQARKHPNETAVIAFGADDARVELSYAELDTRAEQVARTLRARGVRRGQLIGLRTDRNVELVIGLLGIVKAGAAYLPLDPVYPAERVRFMLSDAAVSLVLTQRHLAPDLGDIPVELLCLDESAPWLDTPASPDSPAAGFPDDLVYVIYTSGSTGQPKGVGISHRNVLRLFAATESWFGFTDRDVWTLFHSYAFDFSVWELWGALLYGGRVVVAPQDLSRNPAGFRELLLREAVTVLNQTPTAFRQLIDADRAVPVPGAFALRYVVFGGEALELQSLKPWLERYGDAFPRLINMYGITETTVHVTYRPITHADVAAGRGSVIGEPLPDLRLYLLDPAGQPVPYGVPGEMFVGGAGLAPAGYLNRPELTAQRFLSNPFLPDPAARMYRSGDLARRLDTGELEYLGRIDSQVKIRGFRIELGEIEARIAQHPHVRQIAVIDREDQPGQKRLAAYLVSDAPQAPLLEELRAQLRRTLPDYMLPAHFLFLDALPLTPNGKLDRRALPAPETTRTSKQFVAPRNDAERTIAEVWQAVLRVESVGIDDHFFELGGDSILSIQVIARCRQKGVHITPKDLFQHPTVAQLAAVATAATQVVNAPRTASGRVVLTPIQHWFFDQRFANPNYWNQAFLFEVAADFDPAAFAQALDRVAQRHDALRLRFVADQNEVVQTYSANAGISVDRVDLSQTDTSRQAAAITDYSARAQSRLDLRDGPLLRALHFFTGDTTPGRVLLTIHHAVVDGVSWRILREDLESTYLALESATSPVLPDKTSSMQDWSKRLVEFAQSAKVQSSLPYWREVTAVAPTLVPPDVDRVGTTSSSDLCRATRSLSSSETRALLQRVPKAFRTQINDVLIAALTQAMRTCLGGNAFRFDLEGHGREHIADDVDVSRTVGWFTTLFPIAIHLQDGSPVDILLSVRDQLRKIPMRGMSYGLLRYLSADAGARTALSGAAPSSIVFNYLGQFDAVVADSQLFHFADESTGPWRNPTAHRAHAIEIVSVTRDGMLEMQWQYDTTVHRPATIDRLADEMLTTLRNLVALADDSPAVPFTPGDFPLADLTPDALSLLAARHAVEDIYPLTAMQQMFFAMERAGSNLGFEQWQFRIDGHIDPSLLRRAMDFVVARHSILRTAFVDIGNARAVQVVGSQTPVPWTDHDWRPLAASERTSALAALTQAEATREFDLTKPPAMRMTLCRTAEREWLLLWSTHHLCIDGWSWPILFRDLSQAYAAFASDTEPAMEPTIAYRAYVEWLTHSAPESEAFWREELQPVVASTPLRLSGVTSTASQGSQERTVELPEGVSDALQRMAREHQVTLSVVFNAAWALALSHYSGAETVVFGAAFSGRPAELRHIESMVGPCVSNLPVRADVRETDTIAALLGQMQQRQFALAQNQYASLEQIQSWSSVPWRHRLFESLVVFQNYQIDAQARRIGDHAQLELQVAPEATNYPLTLAVTAGNGLRIRLLYHPSLLSAADVEQFATDLTTILLRLAERPAATVEGIRALLSPALEGKAAALAKPKASASHAPFVAPASEMENLVAQVWSELFGVERISLDDNFFELGGHSLLLLRAHADLRARLNTDLPVVTLLQYPTIRSLANHLSAGASKSSTAETAMDRARKQREAQAKQRTITGRR